MKIVLQINRFSLKINAGVDKPAKELVNPHIRTISKSGANIRSIPNHSNEYWVDTFKPNDKIQVSGWVEGEWIEGNPRWFKLVNSGAFVWTGACVDPITDNLPKLEYNADESIEAPIKPTKIKLGFQARDPE